MSTLTRRIHPAVGLEQPHGVRHVCDRSSPTMDSCCHSVVNVLCARPQCLVLSKVTIMPSMLVAICVCWLNAVVHSRRESLPLIRLAECLSVRMLHLLTRLVVVSFGQEAPSSYSTCATMMQFDNMRRIIARCSLSSSSDRTRRINPQRALRSSSIENEQFRTVRADSSALRFPRF